MPKSRRHRGFSLIEVLLAVGTLAIGMIFIGGTFLVGIHLSGVSAERTTAAVVANEAFAKIKLFGLNIAANPPVGKSSMRYDYEAPPQVPVDPNEFAYPSTRTWANKSFFWSALFRLDPNDPSGRTFQTTVFVSRKAGTSAAFVDPLDLFTPNAWIDRPVLMSVQVNDTVNPPAVSNIITVIDNPATPIQIHDERRWIVPGYTIVEDSTGDIYRVLEYSDDPTATDDIVLDRDWNPNGTYPDPKFVWVVPPPIGRGKGPCIEVYQTKITF